MSDGQHSLVYMAQIIAQTLHRSRGGNPSLPPTRTELGWAWDAACALLDRRDEWEDYGDPLEDITRLSVARPGEDT